jgi:hypothetical protein
MTAMVRLACAAGILALGLVHGAGADEAYWHGVRSNDWSHGIDPGTQLSNWYSEAPPNGAPLKVPTGTAIFAPGALQTNLKITSDVSISQMSFTPDTPLYTFRLLRNKNLVIRRRLTNESATVTPRFTVLYGASIKLLEQARFISAGGAASARIDIDRFGHLLLRDSGRGGDAVVISSGFIEFWDSASAERMTITTRTGGQTVFRDMSTGDRAHLINEQGGKLFFTTSSPVGKIENDGALAIQVNRVQVRQTFTQKVNGTLELLIQSPSLAPRLNVTSGARLAGILAVKARPATTEGVFRIMTAQGGLRGRFANLTFTGRPDLTARLAYSGTEVNLIVRLK